jgi:transcription initiation factor IIE alpha subunit
MPENTLQMALAFADVYGDSLTKRPNTYEKYQFELKPGHTLACFRQQGGRVGAALESHSTKKKRWTWVDLDGVTRAGHSRASAVSVLNRLKDQGFINLNSTQIRYNYVIRLSSDKKVVDALAQSVFERLMNREKRGLERIEQVKSLLELGTCQNAALRTHFGEAVEPGWQCNHCGACEKKGGVEMKGGKLVEVRKSDSKLNTIYKEMAKQLSRKQLTARCFAKFCVGIRSPMFSFGCELAKNKRFGLYAGADVLQVSHTCDLSSEIGKS